MAAAVWRRTVIGISVRTVNPWEQLLEGSDLPFHPDLSVPSLTEVVLPIPHPEAIADVEATAHQQVVERLAGSVTDGMTIAVGAGSRGLVERVAVLRGAISGLRALGAAPFVVPAMGSHGGATAEGQRSMLETLGMTEEAIDCEIRATMETVEVARTHDGMPLYLDRNAAGADRIMPVNRIKPHTCFKGPIESGLTIPAATAAVRAALGPPEPRRSAFTTPSKTAAAFPAITGGGRAARRASSAASSSLWFFSAIASASRRA